MKNKKAVGMAIIVSIILGAIVLVTSVGFLSYGRATAEQAIPALEMRGGLFILSPETPKAQCSGITITCDGLKLTPEVEKYQEYCNVFIDDAKDQPYKVDPVDPTDADAPYMQERDEFYLPINISVSGERGAAYRMYIPDNYDVEGGSIGKEGAQIRASADNPINYKWMTFTQVGEQLWDNNHKIKATARNMLGSGNTEIRHVPLFFWKKGEPPSYNTMCKVLIPVEVDDKKEDIGVKEIKVFYQEETASPLELSVPNYKITRTGEDVKLTTPEGTELKNRVPKNINLILKNYGGTDYGSFCHLIEYEEEKITKENGAIVREVVNSIEEGFEVTEIRNVGVGQERLYVTAEDRNFAGAWSIKLNEEKRDGDSLYIGKIKVTTPVRCIKTQEGGDWLGDPPSVKYYYNFYKPDILNDEDGSNNVLEGEIPVPNADGDVLPILNLGPDLIIYTDEPEGCVEKEIEYKTQSYLGGGDCSVSNTYEWTKNTITKTGNVIPEEKETGNEEGATFNFCSYKNECAHYQVMVEIPVKECIDGLKRNATVEVNVCPPQKSKINIEQDINIIGEKGEEQYDETVTVGKSVTLSGENSVGFRLKKYVWQITKMTNLASGSSDSFNKRYYCCYEDEFMWSTDDCVAGTRSTAPSCNNNVRSCESLCTNAGYSGGVHTIIEESANNVILHSGGGKADNIPIKSCDCTDYPWPTEIKQTRLPKLEYTFREEGVYKVRLKVQDFNGLWGSTGECSLDPYGDKIEWTYKKDGSKKELTCSGDYSGVDGWLRSCNAEERRCCSVTEPIEGYDKKCINVEDMYEDPEIYGGVFEEDTIEVIALDIQPDFELLPKKDIYEIGEKLTLSLEKSKLGESIGDPTYTYNIIGKPDNEALTENLKVTKDNKVDFNLQNEQGKEISVEVTMIPEEDSVAGKFGITKLIFEKSYEDMPAYIDKWCCEGTIAAYPWIPYEENVIHALDVDGNCKGGLSCMNKCRQRGFDRGREVGDIENDNICTPFNYCKCYDTDIYGNEIVEEGDEDCPGGDPFGCHDTDCGVIIEKRGRVTDAEWGDETDYCTGDPNTLREFYCTATGEIDYRDIKCTIGVNPYCDKDEGVCKQGEWSECTDTDGGPKIQTPGTTTDADGMKEDICVDENTVKEWFCLGDGTKTFELIDCPPGYICQSNPLTGTSCKVVEGENEEGESSIYYCYSETGWANSAEWTNKKEYERVGGTEKFPTNSDYCPPSGQTGSKTCNQNCMDNEWFGGGIKSGVGQGELCNCFKCTVNTDCEGTLQCVKGECVECTVNADCEGTLQCVNGECVEY